MDKEVMMNALNNITDKFYITPKHEGWKMLLEEYGKYEIEKCEKKIISDEDGVGKDFSYQRLNRLFNMTDQDLQSDFCFSVSERIAWQMSRGGAIDYELIFNNIFIWDEEAG